MDKLTELNTLNNFFSELKSINVRLNNLKFHEQDNEMNSHYERVCNGVDFLIYKYEQKLENFKL